jgi:hypothetical protein
MNCGALCRSFKLLLFIYQLGYYRYFDSLLNGTKVKADGPMIRMKLFPGALKDGSE